jgi:DNA-binding transcriptional LysR family regulator
MHVRTQGFLKRSQASADLTEVDCAGLLRKTENIGKVFFMMDLSRLRLLREFARRRTMTAVGEGLGLSSSAVSQQFATLEREARIRLFERIGRGVRLTAEGERLLAHAETILAAVEAAETDLHRARAHPAGTLHIACFSTFAKAHLLAAAVRLRERFPQLRAVIHEHESPDAIEAVREGRCEVAITFAYNLVPRADEAGLVTRPLLEEPVLLALPPSWRGEDAPVALESLAQADWITGSRQTDDRLLAERACAAAGFAPRFSHAVDDYDLLLRLVAADFGVGFVPALGLRFSPVDLRAVTPAGALLTRRIQAHTRPALAASPLVGVLLAELADVMRCAAGSPSGGAV